MQPDYSTIATNEDEEDDGRRKPFWRRRESGVAMQLVVFLNGLLLTAIACASLHVFVNDLIAGDYKRLTTDTHQTISTNLQDLEQSVRTLAAITALSASTDETEWKKRVIYAVPHLKYFDRLLLILQDANGQWRQKEILKIDGAHGADMSIIAPGAEPELLKRIGGAANGENTIVITGFPVLTDSKPDADIASEESPFLMIHPLVAGNPGRGLVVGVSRVSNIIDQEWLESRPTLQSINVRDAESNDPVFSLQRTHDVRRPEFMMQGPNFAFRLANHKWRMAVDIGKDAKSAVLEQTPLMVCLAGLLLTLAATMYIRNRQRQAQRLLTVNQVLGQKNRELNTQAAERERLNSVLRKAEREYRFIIDSVTDIIFEVSAEGEILFLNAAWEKITGFSQERSLNRQLFDMFHPQDQEEQRRNFEQMIKGKRANYRAFTRVRTANGTFRAVELSMSMLRQDENRALRVVGAITDVEERRRAERALGEAEKKYRTIVENAAGGIYQVTPEGQFLSANPAMARILGYDSAEQLLREVRNAHKDIYADVRERLQFIRNLEAFNIVKNFETQVKARDGRLLWINENARTVKDDEGNTLFFEGSLEDITRRKEVEIKLREAKVQSDLASRAKSEFLANMSHELRTPLNAIIGFSEIIKDEILGPIQNKQYWEYSRDIYDSGRRLLSIINEILDVSRIEAGERQLNEGIVSLEKLSRSCIEFMSQKAEAGKLIVTSHLDQAPKVIGEELAIKQIILNLLSNAVKFTAPGGHITLSHEIDGEGQLRVSVTDTGVGLDEAEIEKALSPFGQVETSLSRQMTGTGLGLTLVDSLIRLHGGRLELFSQKGIGTTATIVFPARRVAQDNG